MDGTINGGLTAVRDGAKAAIVLPIDHSKRPERRDAATGVSAAGARAIAVRAMSFYFRAPVKAFFRTRVDYMAFARAINPQLKAKEAWSWKTTTPGVLSYVRRPDRFTQHANGFRLFKAKAGVLSPNTLYHPYWAISCLLY